jgi:uncharacterized membrane protein YhhN
VNGAVWLLLGVTVVCAVANWIAVSVEPERTSIVYVAKPATMVALIGVALALDPFDSAVRGWFVAALMFCLAGDVFLMLPKDLFVAGLASFLVGHLCYVGGLVIAHRSWSATALGAALVAVTLAGIAPRIVGSVRRTDRALVGPVLAYVAVISLMVITAWGSWRAWAIAGAVSFYASDATLAWNRFVRPLRHGHLAVMVTYHLGQIGLVLGLCSM